MLPGKNGSGEPPQSDGPRTVYEGMRFSGLRDHNSGRTIENLEFHDCSFDNCSLSAGADPRKRTTVRNVRLAGCRIPLRFGIVGSPFLDEIVVEDLRSGQILIVAGAAFRHVVLAGHMVSINLNEKVSNAAVTEEQARQFRADNDEFYRHVDWALDIRRAEFASASLSSVPGQLIRRDPETQVLVSRGTLMHHDWAALPLPTITRVAVTRCLASRHELQVIVAGKRSSKFEEELRGIEVLRREGLTIEG